MHFFIQEGYLVIMLLFFIFIFGFHPGCEFWVCGFKLLLCSGFVVYIGVFSSSSGKFMGFGFFLDSDCALISGS